MDSKVVERPRGYDYRIVKETTAGGTSCFYLQRHESGPHRQSWDNVSIFDSLEDAKECLQAQTSAEVVERKVVERKVVFETGKLLNE